MKYKHVGYWTNHSVNYLLLLVSMVLFFSSCKDTEKLEDEQINPTPVSPSPKTETYDIKVASEWNDLHLKLLKSDSARTSLSAARSLGYVNLGLYESVVHGTTNKSLVNRLKGFSEIPKTIDSLEYNWGLAANVAQYTLIQSFFPRASANENAEIDALLSKYEKSFRANSSQEVIKRSIEFGASVANAVWNYALKDGLNGTDSLLFDKNYIFPDGLGVWKADPANVKPLLPQWKLLRPMIFSNKYLVASGVKPFSYRKESAFFAEANQVFMASNTLTTSQRERSKYWIGNELNNNATRNIFGVLNEGLKSKDVKLDKAALLYLKGAIMIYDGSIAVWQNKFETNLIRPDTYIRETLDRNWQPILGNSYSPAFPSLAATLAGGIGKLLSVEFGGGISTPFSTSPITIADFKNEITAAEINGGTNFEMSAEGGFALGEKIMDNTLKFDF